MKILHVLSQYPDSTGSGIYVQAILREAKKNGHTNRLIAAQNKDRPATPSALAAVAAEFITFGNRPLDFALPGMSDVMPYPSSRFSTLTTAQLNNYKTAFIDCIGRHIAAFKPDLIHSHHLWLVSSFIKQKFPDIPLVTSCHGTDLRQLRLCPHLCTDVLRGCRQVNRVLALSGTQKKEVIDLYGIPQDKIDIVGAGFNDSLFSWSEKSPPPPVHIVYCGKLSKAKGVPWLLRAFRRLSAKDSHLHLVGGGSGKEKDECIALAKSLGSQITLYGTLSQKDLAGLLQKSHIFILPSLFEGLPLVILEALSCGCKVISTQLPGCQEILAKTGADLLSLIPLPRLETIDTPRQEDEPRFVAEIARELEKAISFIHKHPATDSKVVREKTEAFTWKKVFVKIQSSYQTLC